MNCRGCGGSSFGEVIDLGSMPLVNNLLAHPQEQCARWPLKAVYCRGCSLVQLTSAPPVYAMFDQYLYFSSHSQTMLDHARGLVAKYVRPGDRVLEVASNDGYLLRQAQRGGAEVIGIDPATNIAAYANSQGIPTRCEYFNTRAAEHLARMWGRANVVFALNVLAHAADPHEIMRGLKFVLAEHGLAHFEVPYLPAMLAQTAFDSIYHEHQMYFSITALKPIVNACGLKIVNVQNIDVHCGSIHVQLAHEGDESAACEYCERERELGVLRSSYYSEFQSSVRSVENALRQVLSDFECIVAHGAAAKGVVLLNHYGLDVRQIPFVVDVSPHKQGRYIPGTRQPIVSPDRLLELSPDAILVLAWNLATEISSANRDYLSHGGQLILPLPTPRVISSCEATPACVGA